MWAALAFPVPRGPRARNLPAAGPVRQARDTGKGLPMISAMKAIEPTTISKVVLTVTRGVTAGWIAGIPQVLVTQVVGQLEGGRERADIGPHFIRQATRQTGRPVSPLVEWLLAGVFHFEYAAWWGALYALAVEPLGARRVP